jgi:hypothetical protein
MFWQSTTGFTQTLNGVGAILEDEMAGMKIRWVAQVSLLRPGAAGGTHCAEKPRVSKARPGPPIQAQDFAAKILANRGVVFVAVNATGFLVLLRVEGRPILFRQVSVILCAHTALFPVDAGFLVFQVPRLPCGQLAAFDPIANAILLRDLALVDVIVVCAGGWCLGQQGRRREQQSGSKYSRENFHGLLLFSAAVFIILAARSK